MPRRGLGCILVFTMLFAMLRSAAAQETIELSVASLRAYEQMDPGSMQRGAMLDVQLGEMSKSLFTEWSREHVGRRIEIRVDGTAIGEPVVLRTSITGGVLVVAVFSLDTAQELVSRFDREEVVLTVATVP